LIEAHKVTQTWAPNFGFKLASDRLSRISGRKWDLSSVKFFMNAGEQVTMPVLRSFLKEVAPFGVRPGAMQPAFGMAEVCTCMTYANEFNLRTGARRFMKSSLDGVLEPTIESNGSSVEFVSLGPPVPGVSIRIADSANRLVPEGVIGRLQIKGKVVTPGYLHNPEANDEAFVGGGWFNTGDLGFIHDGELFLTGREKEMIIIRGAKFYCYEIEDVANQVAGVAPTFCAACSIADATAGTEQLAIFFVAEPDSDPVRITDHVRRRVSALMGVAPRYIIPLAKADFPKTTSGKIQRTQLKKALEAGSFRTLLEQLDRKSSSSECAQPAPGTETRVAGIWREVLGLIDVPANKSLFALGGDSLKAIQIISRLREGFRVEFPLAKLFEEDATVRDMSEWIEHNHQQTDVGSPPSVSRAASREEFPASTSQLRIWLADQIEPGTSRYNICRVLRLRGALDTRALELALNGIVQRHEILRTVFVFDGALNQRVVPDSPMALPMDDLRTLPAASRESEVQARVDVEANRCFDLVSCPLFRARLLILDDAEHLLLLRFHQIIVDGWSIPIFYRELAELYQASIEGRPPDLAPLPIQYGDYSSWQQRWMTDSHLKTQIDYWRNRVTTEPPESELNLFRALDCSGHQTPVTSRAGATVEALILDQALVASLREFNAREGQTRFVTLLAAYKLLLYRWSGCHDIVVGSAAAGRTRLETEGLIGFFVNTLTLRTDVSGARTFRELSRRVRETSAGAFAHSEAPFERVSLAHLAVTRNARRRCFQVWFSPIDAQMPFDLGNVKATPQMVFPRGAQFDLSLFISEAPGGLACYFEYQEGLFDRDRIARFASEYETLLRKVIANPDLPLD
jgi:acyl carrier protein